jgi:hypothetical protein
VLQKTLERKDIVEQATASPAEQEYVQSYHDVTKSVKKKSPLAGSDIINYLKKKDKFKGSLKAAAHLPQPPEDGAPDGGSRGAGSPTKKKRPGNMSVEGSREKIETFFKEQGVRKSSTGTVVHRGSRLDIPYDDFINDLKHNFSSTDPSMTPAETTTGLNLLKRIRIPTSHIRSTRLRSKYTALRTRGPGTLPSPKSSMSSENIPSRIPVRSALQLTRTDKSMQSHFPSVYERRSRPSNVHTSELNKDISKLLGRK